MGNKNIIESLRIWEKRPNENKLFNVIRNVDSKITLKDLRELNHKKITFDYKFLDGENPISEEFEQKYMVKDLIKDNNFVIYIHKISEINPLIKNKIDNLKYSSKNESTDTENKNTISFEYNQNKNKNFPKFSLKDFINNNPKSKEILKLINPILKILINKIDDTNTIIDFFFPDYNKDVNLFNEFILFNKNYKISNNYLQINVSDLEKKYYKEKYIITELILKNEEEEYKFLITLYIKKNNILNVFIKINEYNLYSLEIIYYGKRKEDFEEVILHSG